MFSLKTIIDELDLLMKAVITQWNIKKKKKKRCGIACS